MRHIAYIALGSNLQDPVAQIRQALAELAELPETTMVCASSLYSSAPVGYDNQPDFINAVAEISTSLTPLALLQAMLNIETQHGRDRPFPNAPRELDLDLLLYDDLVLQTTTLTLPHPRMHGRAFVLQPLLEIAPQLEVPGHGRVTDLAQQCADQGVRLA